MNYKELLQEIYSEVLNGEYNEEVFKKEYEDYIKKSIKSIDEKWGANIEKFNESKKNVNLVIIGEAPMWGDSGSYIYNERKEIKETDFFRLRHLRVTSSGSNENIQLVSVLLDKGIIFLDVSPFPFNPKNTSICYSNRNSKNSSKRIGKKIYKKIIDKTFSNHFAPKLKKILELTTEEKPLIFAYRYKKLIRMHKTIRNCCLNAKIDYPESLIHISTESSRINQDELDKVLLKIEKEIVSD